MKRFLFFITFFALIISNSIFAKTSEDTKIQFAMLMNQVQYTMCTIMQNKDKETLSNEFDFVINQIDKSKLYDYSIRMAYEDLLKTLKELKLTENEREFVITMNDREQKQAYTQAFKSFGSVFTGGSTPLSLVTSLVHTGISAGLNIMSAKNQADNKLAEKLFQLEQKELTSIDEMRIGLWSTWTNVITNYKIPVSYEISETEMKDFVQKIAENANNPQNLITILEGKKEKFKLFPVYWYQLGAQYHLANNLKKANECYDEFESLVKKYSYLKTDPYYICVAKNRIELLRETGVAKNASAVRNYLQIIEKNIIPENGSENRVYCAGIYAELGQYGKAKDLLQLNISRNEHYATSTELLALIEYEENKNSNTLNTAVLLELNCINVDLVSSDTVRVSIPKRFAEGRLCIVSCNGEYSPYPYPLKSERDDVCEIENTVSLNKKDTFEVAVTLIDHDGNVIKLMYDCDFVNKNESVNKLLKDVSLSVDDLDACLLKGIFAKLSKFSYDPKDDPSYIQLANTHKEQTSKQTSKDRKKVWEDEEKEKLDYLKVNGRISAITNVISEETKKLHSCPYFSSKSSVDSKGNILTYSLKKVFYFNDTYTFAQYGLGTISKTERLLEKVAHTNTTEQYALSKRYMTGSGVKQDATNSLIYLYLAAFNNSADAQYDLGTMYANDASDLAKFYKSSGYSFVRLLPGILQYGKEVFQRNDTIEHEKIAFYWYKRSADNGHGKAVYEIAKRYENGLGVEKDSALAQKYYEDAYKIYGIRDAQKKIK